MWKLRLERNVKRLFQENTIELFQFLLISCYILQFQPSKQKNKKKVDFDTNFEFVSSVDEYNKDVWNDLTKYIKRKAKFKTDDKIKKIRSQTKEDEGEKCEANDVLQKDEESDISLSEDELKYDNIKTKEKKARKKKNTDIKSEPEDAFFEDVDFTNDNISFYQMNISRPLLKAIGEMKFVHPTPIQAATIPPALLGQSSKLVLTHHYGIV